MELKENSETENILLQDGQGQNETEEAKADKTKTGKVKQPVDIPRVDILEHGFKKPLELQGCHKNAATVEFRRGTTPYRITTADALRIGNSGPIKPGIAVGSIPWNVAIGLFVNNLDGGANAAVNKILEESKESIFTNNIN